MTDPLAPRPILVRAFPATDRDFGEFAGSALAGVDLTGADPTALRETAERRLRKVYPNAHIAVQDALADLALPQTGWYAYRDGRIRHPDARRDRLYQLVAAARRTVGEAQAALDHSRAVSRIAGYLDPPRSEGATVPQTQPPPSSSRRRTRPRVPDEG